MTCRQSAALSTFVVVANFLCFPSIGLRGLHRRLPFLPVVGYCYYRHHCTPLPSIGPLYPIKEPRFKRTTVYHKGTATLILAPCTVHCSGVSLANVPLDSGNNKSSGHFKLIYIALPITDQERVSVLVPVSRLFFLAPSRCSCQR